MNTDFINMFINREQSVSEYIRLLFAATDDQHMLHIPDLEFDSDDHPHVSSYRTYSMNWDAHDMEQSIHACKQLTEDIRAIAILWNENNAKNAFLHALDRNPNLHTVWENYIEFMLNDDFDTVCCDIINSSANMSKADWALYETLRAQAVEEANRRIGGNGYAYDIAMCCMRLFKLFHLNAPGILLKNEMLDLAQAMILNAYCIDPISDAEADRHDALSRFIALGKAETTV